MPIDDAFPVHIARTPEGDYLLTWTDEFSSHDVDVSMGAAPELAAGSEPVVRAAHSGVRVAAGPERRRRYFHLRPQRGEAVTAAERALPLDAGRSTAPVTPPLEPSKALPLDTRALRPRSEEACNA